MSIFANIVDATLETSVIGSFTRIGALARRRLDGWDHTELARLDGKVVVISGATSGLGLVTARALLSLGAHVTMLARNVSKAAAVCKQLADGLPKVKIDFVEAEMGDFASVRAAAQQLRARHTHIDVLIHNAGALDDGFHLNSSGVEQTVASHVVGPFLLTELLLPQLSATGSGPMSRILWVTSGGMYTQPLNVDSLQMSKDNYDGATAYARAKRAQVTLVPMMAQELSSRGISVHCMHPGWADTPGVAASLPTFRRVVGGLLRSPEEGADTLIWLASSPVAIATSGQFWHDRRVRNAHRGWASRRADTAVERAKLWNWLVHTSGSSAW